MLQRLAIQFLGGVGLYLMMGAVAVVYAAQSGAWVVPLFSQGQSSCGKGNPYCGAGVSPPANMPSAKFDPNQTACNTANGACAQQYSKMMTDNYQQRMAGAVSPPYNPCTMAEGCASVQAWWKQQVVVPIQQKTIPYDPGQRAWTQKKSCGTIFVGGVYVNNPNC